MKNITLIDYTELERMVGYQEWLPTPYMDLSSYAYDGKKINHWYWLLEDVIKFYNDILIGY